MAQRKGSRLRAAQLLDPRNLAEAELQVEKASQAGSVKPSLEDFDHVVEAIYLVSDDIRTLVGALTNAELPPRPRPAGPLDVIADRKKQIGLSKIREITGEE